MPNDMIELSRDCEATRGALRRRAGTAGRKLACESRSRSAAAIR